MMLDIFMVTHLNTSKSFGLLTEKKALSLEWESQRRFKNEEKKKRKNRMMTHNLSLNFFINVFLNTEI